MNSWLATRSAMLRDRGLALQNRPLGATMREPRRKADAQLRAQSGPKGVNDLSVRVAQSGIGLRVLRLFLTVICKMLRNRSKA